MKKLLTFIGLMLIVASLSFGASLWWANYSDNDSQSGAPSILNRFSAADAEFRAPAKGPVKITSEEASFPHLVSSGEEIRYYVFRTGAIKALDLRNTKSKSKILTTLKPRALELTWSPDGTEVIANYGTERIYTNLATGASKPLDRNITNLAFARTSNQVAYLSFDQKTGAGTIAIADAQITTFKTILKTRLKNWELQWTDSRRLSLVALADVTKLESLLVLDTETKALDMIVDGKFSIESTWAPDGTQMIYSRQTRKGLELFHFDLSKRRHTQLKLFGRAGKCAWSPDGATMWCAVPEKPLAANDAKGSEDAIVKLTTADLGTKPEKLFTPADAGFVDARELMYAPTLNALLFKNFKDGRLYFLSLAQ